ncbi:site-2 protease family protein [Qipengyuania sp. JC766]|uniref:site-2 protease family protein n=1 Tax=Qipengyuania sp. JC766 TaxID=3232139 RepID=UPI00345AEE03
MTETLSLILILVPCLVIAIVFHEVAHGWTALALGDTTARDRGRLTLNPVRHVDPVGTLVVPGALALLGGPIFGWAKPVPVLRNRLNNPRFGMMLVAAAGPLTNLVLAVFGAAALGIAYGQISGPPEGLLAGVIQGLQIFLLLNIFLALFNLLPIPPFDGSHIAEGLMPRSMAVQFQKLQQVGMLFLIGLIAVTWAFPQTGIIERFVLPPVDWLFGYYNALALWIAGF